MYPPLSGGGLIEAASRKQGARHSTRYPPLSGGGLIEACRISWSLCERIWYPPLSGGGLIEAASPPGAISRSSWYPPLSGGGLIEAVWNRRSRTQETPLYPPLSGGGLIEATSYTFPAARPLGIRRFRAAASLKHLRQIGCNARLTVVSAAFGRRPH